MGVLVCGECVHLGGGTTHGSVNFGQNFYTSCVSTRECVNPCGVSEYKACNNGVGDWVERDQNEKITPGKEILFKIWNEKPEVE